MCAAPNGPIPLEVRSILARMLSFSLANLSQPLSLISQESKSTDDY
jgi:hypothetical protein